MVASMVAHKIRGSEDGGVVGLVDADDRSSKRGENE